MRLRFGLHWQIILVGVLFAASLAMLLLSTLGAIHLPARERESRHELTEASRRMAEEAAPLLEELPASPREPPPSWQRRLTDIANSALQTLPEVEGGFYLPNRGKEGEGMFVAHVFPNDPHPTPEPPAPLPKKKGKKHASPPRPPLSPDPPPREKSIIHDQCVDSLTREEGAPPIVQVRDIGPSRVMIVTEAVGRQRPAPMAAWVMTRLTSPETTAARLTRIQTATGLALAGMGVALILMVNLGRNLRRERRQRDQLREELRHAEHFAALGKLLAGVAHEVRNPLAAIRSTVQLYQRLSQEKRDPSSLDTILAGVDRLNALVSRLLFFVRSGHEQHRSVDVNAIVREALTLLNAQAEAQRVELRTELASDLPLLHGSLQALQQVLLNLMTNALQAMPDGGTLLCRTRRLPLTPTLSPEGRGQGEGGIELCIADTGPGIPAEELPHLFEPFHTTRPEGTGLGLALCREIVQQHGGRIELVRQEGWGAVFLVMLPRTGPLTAEDQSS